MSKPTPALPVISALLGACVAAGALSFNLASAHPYTLSKELWCVVLPVWMFVLVAARFAVRAGALRVPREALLCLGFTLWAGLSLLWAQSPAAGVQAVLQSVQNFMGLMLGAWVLSSTTARTRFLLGLVIAGFLTAILGILQWRHWDALLLGTSMEAFAALPQVDSPAAVFGHVNMAAEVALVGCLAGIGLLGDGRRTVRWFAASTVLVAAAYLLIGGSRAAWIGLFLGCLAWCALWLRAKPVGQRAAAGVRLTVGVAGLVLLLAAVDPLVLVPGRGGGADVHPSDRLADLLTLDTGTERERLVLWQNSLAMWSDAPLSGIGAGNWSVAYPAYSRAIAVLDPGAYNLQRQPEAAHMEALQLLCETGLCGFVLMSLVFLSALGAGRRAGLERGAFTAIVVALCGASTAAYVFQNVVPSCVAFFALGALVSSDGARRGDLVLRRLWPLVVGVSVLALFLTLNWHARTEASRQLREARNVRMALNLDGAERPRQLQVLDALDRAAARRPGDYQLHAERALALWDLGLNDQALESFDRVLALNPDFVNALLLKAVLLQQRAELPEAYALLHRALIIQPQSPELRYALGQIFEAWTRSTGGVANLHAAVAQYRQAASSREYMPLARVALARLLLEFGGDLAECVRMLTKAEENAALQPDLLAVCARMYGHHRLLALAPGLYGPGGARTLAVWRRVLALAPEHSEARIEVAMAPLHAGSTPDAAQLDQMLAALQGGGELNSITVTYYQARVLELAGRPQEALRDWTRILREGIDAWHSHPRRQSMIDEALLAVQRLQALVR